MAAIQSTQVKKLYDNESEDRLVVLQLRNVTTADTYDASGYFASVDGAVALCASGALTDDIPAAISGDTTITLTLTSMAKDTVVLVMRGAKAV